MKVANREDLVAEAHRTRGIGKEAPADKEKAVSVADFFAQFEQDDSNTPRPPRVKHNVMKLLFYKRKLDLIEKIIYKWREWNNEAEKINTERQNIREEKEEEKSAPTHIISSLLEMNVTELGKEGIDDEDIGLIKSINQKQPALYKFIPTEDDTLITLINKFIYFNFIYNKLIQSDAKYNYWKAQGNFPPAIEHMQLVFFDNIRSVSYTHLTLPTILLV